jgi:hypothetical protein
MERSERRKRKRRRREGEDTEIPPISGEAGTTDPPEDANEVTRPLLGRRSRFERIRIRLFRKCSANPTRQRHMSFRFQCIAASKLA